MNDKEKLANLIDSVSSLLYVVKDTFPEGEKRNKYIKDVKELKEKWIDELLED